MRTKDVEIGIIITILSGKSASIGHTAITVPAHMEINRAIEQMIEKKVVRVEIDDVKCVKGKDGCFVSFLCQIHEIKDALMVVNYIISDEEYNGLNSIFSKQKNLKKSNSDMAVCLIKNIIDKYDMPFIQIADKD